MHATRYLPALLALGTSATLAGTGGCDRPALYARLTSTDAPATAPAPDRSSPHGSPRSRTARLSLVDNPLLMDGFKYDAVVDIDTGQAWLLQFGGLAGGVRRTGPVSVALEMVQGCPEVRAAQRAAARRGWGRSRAPARIPARVRPESLKTRPCAAKPDSPRLRWGRH